MEIRAHQRVESAGGGIIFSDSDVTAYIDSEGQRTESLVLSGDPENEIALPLREKWCL